MIAQSDRPLYINLKRSRGNYKVKFTTQLKHLINIFLGLRFWDGDAKVETQKVPEKNDEYENKEKFFLKKMAKMLNSRNFNKFIKFFITK